MNYKEMPIEILKMKKAELEYEVDILERSLEIFPTSSPLGRLSLRSALKYKTKKLNEVKEELKNRGYTYGC
jgi:predicted HTH domain antitoxin